jgi:hypothetical protein
MKIKIVFSRTEYDPVSAWPEFRNIEVEVPDNLTAEQAEEWNNYPAYQRERLGGTRTIELYGDDRIIDRVVERTYARHPASSTKRDAAASRAVRRRLPENLSGRVLGRQGRECQGVGGEKYNGLHGLFRKATARRVCRH